MINIIWEESFTKKIKKLIKNQPDLNERIFDKIRLFSENQFEPSLKTHKLSGTLSNYWAFSIDYYYRIVFRFGKNNQVFFISIGSHDEVY